ncbi:hypothetical protein GA829_33330 (plasmid) [Mesorhizobium sp. INR15]|nr:hypothetical protein GA829_33330 [Mesorhizobium sp. INR15]
MSAGLFALLLSFNDLLISLFLSDLDDDAVDCHLEQHHHADIAGHRGRQHLPASNVAYGTGCDWHTTP